MQFLSCIICKFRFGCWLCQVWWKAWCINPPHLVFVIDCPSLGGYFPFFIQNHIVERRSGAPGTLLPTLTFIHPSSDCSHLACSPSAVMCFPIHEDSLASGIPLELQPFFCCRIPHSSLQYFCRKNRTDPSKKKIVC